MTSTTEMLTMNTNHTVSYQNELDAVKNGVVIEHFPSIWWGDNCLAKDAKTGQRIRVGHNLWVMAEIEKMGIPIVTVQG